jgi:hypothetical protein
MSPTKPIAVALLLIATIPFALQGQAGSLPLTLFQYDRSQPLGLRDSLVRTDSGVAVHRIAFASPRGGTVTGLLFLPGGPGPHPGVVVMHGAPGTAEGMTKVAMPLARHGAVAIAIDAPWARRKAPPITLTVQDSVDQVQLIVDLERAVDVLIARPDVDSKRLGYTGRSYGGAMGSLFAGVERRLKTYVIQVGDGGLVAHFTGPDDGGKPPEGVPQAQFDRWLAAMRPIEPIRFVGRAAPASLFFQSARRDELIPIADAEALHAAGSSPKEVRWYDTGHPLDAAALHDLLEWFSRTLGSRPPAG